MRQLLRFVFLFLAWNCRSLARDCLRRAARLQRDARDAYDREAAYLASARKLQQQNDKGETDAGNL